MSIPGADDPFRHCLERFVPGDAGELGFAALPGPLHRVKQAVGAVLAESIGPAADAGPQLRIGRLVGRPVVGVDADDGVAADPDAEKTAAAAVVGRAARPDHAIGAGDGFVHAVRRSRRGAAA